MRKNAISSLMALGLLFDFCQIVENLLRIELQDRTADPWMFASSLEKLSRTKSLGLGRDLRVRVNDDFKGNRINQSLQDLISNQYSVDGRQISGTEADFAITYGLRNTAAHQIVNYSVISDDFDTIVQMVFKSPLLTRICGCHLSDNSLGEAISWPFLPH